MLTSAILAAHKSKPCLFIHDVERGAVTCSAALRTMLAKFRDVKRDEEKIRRYRSQACL